MLGVHGLEESRGKAMGDIDKGPLTSVLVWATCPEFFNRAAREQLNDKARPTFAYTALDCEMDKLDSHRLVRIGFDNDEISVDAVVDDAMRLVVRVWAVLPCSAKGSRKQPNGKPMSPCACQSPCVRIRVERTRGGGKGKGLWSQRSIFMDHM